MKAKLCLFAVCAALSAMTVAPQAVAITVAVGTCTNFANYASIQTAVNSVPADTVIEVCPGNYAEERNHRK